MKNLAILFTFGALACGTSTPPGDALGSVDSGAVDAGPPQFKTYTLNLRGVPGSVVNAHTQLSFFPPSVSFDLSQSTKNVIFSTTTLGAKYPDRDYGQIMRGAANGTIPSSFYSPQDFTCNAPGKLTQVALLEPLKFPKDTVYLRSARVDLSADVAAFVSEDVICYAVHSLRGWIWKFPHPDIVVDNRGDGLLGGGLAHVVLAIDEAGVDQLVVAANGLDGAEVSKITYEAAPYP